MVNILKINKIPKRKRVAAYARVSVGTERLSHSLSAQISFYSRLIQSRPEWEYAGVYADEGISGTSASKRPEFIRLLADCEAGKINLILTKSISRFARNTVDLLNTVRRLKNIGVEVRFEKEGISTFDGTGEVMLTLLASFAQEEIVSLSNNIKWGIRKRYEQGRPFFHGSILGYHWEGDDLIVVPEEAGIVRRIYFDFLLGKSPYRIADALNAEQILTKRGNRWIGPSVRIVLTNPVYAGHIIYQKSYVLDPISKMKMKNCGELPKYIVEDAHEPIISPEIFEYVQEEWRRRIAAGRDRTSYFHTSEFTKHILCPHCGCYFRRCGGVRQGGRWRCANRKKGGSCPTAVTVPESALKECAAEITGKAEYTVQEFDAAIENIIIPRNFVMEFHLKSGEVITRLWKPRKMRREWLEQ